MRWREAHEQDAANSTGFAHSLLGSKSSVLAFDLQEAAAGEQDRKGGWHGEQGSQEYEGQVWGVEGSVRAVFALRRLRRLAAGLMPGGSGAR